jgi:hypothetical protein
MAWTLISSLDAPTAGAFTFSPLTLTGYNAVQIVMSGITVTTDGSDIYLTFYVGGVEIVTGYRWGALGMSSSASNVDDGDISDPRIVLGLGNITNWNTGNDSRESFGGIVTVLAPVSTSLYKLAMGDVYGIGDSGSVIFQHCDGVMENTGAINGLKISGSSNLTAGKVRIIGL